VYFGVYVYIPKYLDASAGSENKIFFLGKYRNFNGNFCPLNFCKFLVLGTFNSNKNLNVFVA